VPEAVIGHRDCSYSAAKYRVPDAEITRLAPIRGRP
jgi:hypothetical protein